MVVDVSPRDRVWKKKQTTVQALQTKNIDTIKKNNGVQIDKFDNTLGTNNNDDYFVELMTDKSYELDEGISFKSTGLLQLAAWVSNQDCTVG